jgi:hypothetical protein
VQAIALARKNAEQTAHYQRTLNIYNG